MKELGFIFVFEYNGNTEAPASLQDGRYRIGQIVIDSQDGSEYDTLARIAGVDSVVDVSKFFSTEGTPYFSEVDRQAVLKETREKFPDATFA